jgi:N4-gp56 family major capsid protein
MSLTSVNAANRVAQWRKDFFSEFVRENRFNKYLGTDENAIIQLDENLKKSAGDRITFSLLRRLTQAATTGTATMVGSEESLLNYGHLVTVNMRRNAVKVHKAEQIKTEFDLLQAAKTALLQWQKGDARDLIISALGSAKIDGLTPYASCTEGEKDAWLVANADRVLFGAVKGNYSGDHSADLAKVDNSADKLTYSVVSLAKRMAKVASPHIAPVSTTDDEEWYVMFCNSYAFRDLKASLATINQNAEVRGKTNPLYTDGDLLWDGVICREVPEISVIASTIDVAPNYLCGAQAIGMAFAQRPKPITDMTADYEAQPGVCIETIYGVEKLMNNSVQNGVLTVYTAGVADA